MHISTGAFYWLLKSAHILYTEMYVYMGLWLEQWALEIMCCRNNESAELWAVGIMSCRNNGLSELWAFGIMGCRINGSSEQ